VGGILGYDFFLEFHRIEIDLRNSEAVFHIMDADYEEKASD
jgi:hypothetical protein